MIEERSNSTTLGFSERPLGSQASSQAMELVPTLSIIFHPNPKRIGERLIMSEIPAGREIALGRKQPTFSKNASQLGKPLLDPFISRNPLVFRAVPVGGLLIDSSRCRTQLLVNGISAEPEHEFDRAHLVAGAVLELAERVVLLLSLRVPTWDPHPARHGLIGDSAALCQVKEAVARVADLSIPVLLRGESGTGKELVASAIHHSGPRRSGPFVCVNLGALTPSLAASELFGSAKGAFTGAVQSRQGLFRRAQGGTLFLDEVGEAPTDVQVMLLRVLETGEILPVGGDQAQPVDVRIIAATDANLEGMAQTKAFRLPLLHRLAGYELRLPTLCERREDLGLLLRHFLQRELAEVGEQQRLMVTHPQQEPWFPASLVSRMLDYSWPGNIRELRNVLRQLVVASRGRKRLVIDKVITEKLAANKAPTATATPTTKPVVGRVKRRKPSSINEAELIEALAHERWDLEAAAQRLNVARSSLYPLIRKSPNIRTATDLDGEEITACYHQCAGDLTAMVDHLQVSGKALKRRIYELGLAQRAAPFGGV